MTTPIFILSLPRSGSTLLQRLLLASGQCATLGEPSLLLRFLDNPDSIQRLATYWESLLQKSAEDIRAEWPEFDMVYRSKVRDLAHAVYSGLAGEKIYFIDKTPRYTLIAEEIIQTFPDAKFIVLWRHPIAIAASLVDSYREGCWALRDFEIDLYKGLDNLFDFSRKHSEKILDLRYEDLVAAPEKQLKRIGDYLQIPKLEDCSGSELLKTAGGRLGDQTGRIAYNRVSADSSEKWILKINNWYRRRWVRNYLDEKRLKMLKVLDYEVPDQLLRGHLNLVLGCRDWMGSSYGEQKRERSPKSKRIERRYNKKNGHHISFR